MLFEWVVMVWVLVPGVVLVALVEWVVVHRVVAVWALVVVVVLLLLVFWVAAHLGRVLWDLLLLLCPWLVQW